MAPQGKAASRRATTRLFFLSFKTGRRARTRQSTGQRQDRPKCDATGQGQGRPQGKDWADYCHSLGKKRAGRWSRTGQAAGQGQVFGQEQDKPQAKDKAGHRARALARQVTV